MTDSETIFENLCSERNVYWERIPVTGKQKKPDYRIVLKETTVVVEIKEIDSDNLLQQLERTSDDTSPAILSDGVKLIRNKIDKAKKQFREDLEFSKILVIFDSRPFGVSVDWEDVLQAMYGDEINRLHSRSKNNTLESKQAVHRFGGKRKVCNGPEKLDTPHRGEVD